MIVIDVFLRELSVVMIGRFVICKLYCYVKLIWKEMDMFLLECFGNMFSNSFLIKWVMLKFLFLYDNVVYID